MVTQPVIKLTKKKEVKQAPKKEGTIYLEKGKKKDPYVAQKPITQPVNQPIPKKKTLGGAIAGMLTGKTMEEAAEKQGGKLVAGIAPIGPAGIPADVIKTAAGKGISAEQVAAAFKTAGGINTAAATKGAGMLASVTAKNTAGNAALKAASGMMVKSPTGGIIGTLGGASKIIPNTVTAAKTTSFLSKLVTQAKAKPLIATAVGVGAIMSVTGAIQQAIGTYPFAGFIKEEALQTIGYALTTALRDGDIEGAEKAIAFQKELLNVTIWEKIIGAIPYANVQKANKDFYKAATIKLEIDSKKFEKMKIDMAKKEAGIKAGKLDPKSPTADWNEITKDREIKREKERAEDKAYYEKVEENKAKAKAEERKEDEKHWAKILAEQQKKQEEKRRADDEYWAAIRKQKEENAPSKLRFGLLK